VPVSAGTEIATGTATAAANCVTTLATAAAVGDLVVVTGNTDGNVLTSVTDSVGGNTWTRTINTQQSSTVCGVIAWSKLVNGLGVGATITVTTGGTNTYLTHVEKFDGTTVATSPLDQSKGAGGASGTAADSANMASATVQADDLLVGALSTTSSSGTDGVVSPTWTTTTTENQANGATIKLRQVYRDVAATGTYNYAATITSDVWYASIIAFKALVVTTPVLPGFTPHRMPLGA
jgi:hypothetical protein